MKVSEILKKNEVTISCEIFPPKQGAQLQNYKAIAAEIAKLKPAYISCTYGATGGTSDYTVEIADAINSYGVPAIAHLTCVSSTREKVHTVIHELKERGIENILALRGDIPTNTDFPLPDQYHHAIELIREIKEAGDFCIGGACYPEGHPEAANMNEDLDHLKEINDSFGHIEGDFAIRRCAETLKSAVGENGVTGRIGGDEFCAMIPGNEDDGQRIREQIRRESNEFNCDSDKPYYVELSVGYHVVRCGSELVISDVLKDADKALYEEKKKRRKSVKKHFEQKK